MFAYHRSLLCNSISLSLTSSSNIFGIAALAWKFVYSPSPCGLLDAFFDFRRSICEVYVPRWCCGFGCSNLAPWMVRWYKGGLPIAVHCPGWFLVYPSVLRGITPLFMLGFVVFCSASNIFCSWTFWKTKIVLGSGWFCPSNRVALDQIKFMITPVRQHFI